MAKARTLEELIVLFKEKQPELSKEITINKIVVGSRNLIVTTKYGVCYTSTNNLLKGVTPKIQTALNKNIYFNSMLSQEQPELYNSIIILSNYIDTDTHLDILTKYGVCSVYPMNLIKGRNPTIRSAVNKKEFFIAQANEVHGLKYNYKDSIYINATTNLTILCNICNNKFQQSPHSHVDNGAGCPECAKLNSDGFYNLKLAERNKDKWININAIVYTIVCSGNGENFFKVGITTKNSTIDRFKGCMPYDYYILEEIHTNLYKAVFIENNIHKMLNHIQYTPKIHFGGYTECFKKK